jgi:hypothetical protein
MRMADRYFLYGRMATRDRGVRHGIALHRGRRIFGCRAARISTELENVGVAFPAHGYSGADAISLASPRPLRP